jgi:methylated-DNA-[protein]-cysteine S-methyltransferase
MDQLDDLLAEYFDPAVAPAGLAARLARMRIERVGGGAAGRDADTLVAEVTRFRIEANDRGVHRLTYGPGGDETTRRGARHAAQAREELEEYLAGRRTFFAVPVDLAGVGAFQAKVLREAARIPYGATTSYAELAKRVGHPRASRAVGNALGANPVPVIVPCHRIIRGDGSWGHYAFGAPMKTALLTLERATPLLVGCSTTRIVCRRGCRHEQRMKESSRVVFASAADARSVGYRPCSVCRAREH